MLLLYPCAFFFVTSMVGIFLVSPGSILSDPWLVIVALSLSKLNCTLLCDVKKDFLKNTGVDSSS